MPAAFRICSVPSANSLAVGGPLRNTSGLARFLSSVKYFGISVRELAIEDFLLQVPASPAPA